MIQRCKRLTIYCMPMQLTQNQDEIEYTACYKNNFARLNFARLIRFISETRHSKQNYSHCNIFHIFSTSSGEKVTTALYILVLV